MTLVAMNMDDFFKNMDFADVFEDSSAYNTSTNTPETNETQQPHQYHRKLHSHHTHHGDQNSGEPDPFSNIPKLDSNQQSELWRLFKPHFAITEPVQQQSISPILFFWSTDCQFINVT
ncbi:unnamed protein product [Ambrosiozyma monospora]|uniref:Unnamed protein product n=1 Tax=Ambrosiozyma monospora TaxID=43982 RepID=A0ACB5U955_AMBMO|nr:unnamed protein product [Ambrosiozyma monospora]